MVGAAAVATTEAEVDVEVEGDGVGDVDRPRTGMMIAIVTQINRRFNASNVTNSGTMHRIVQTENKNKTKRILLMREKMGQLYY
jgi:hypothetical protein